MNNMAILKQRLNRKNASGSYDTVYLETRADLVTRSNGSNVESSLTSMQSAINTLQSSSSGVSAHASTHAAGGSDAITPASIGAATSSHTHSNYASSTHTHNYAGSSSAGGSATSAVKLATARTIRTNLASTSSASFNGTTNITPGVTGTLPIANGGTGCTTLATAKSSLGITSPTITPPAYPSIGNVGTTLSWAGKTWRVVHKVSGIAILALEYWEEDIKWVGFTTAGLIFTYENSQAWIKCMEFSSKLNLFAAEYIIPVYGLPCFIASQEQVISMGGTNTFSYFATNNNRAFYDTNGVAYPWWVNGIHCGINASDEQSSVCCIFTGVVNHEAGGGSTIYQLPTYLRGFRPFVMIRL